MSAPVDDDPREAWADDVRETVANETKNLLKRKIAGETLNPLTASLAFADQNIKGIALTVNRNAAKFNAAGIACSAGCAACCHVRVSVLSAEAFTIAEHIKAKFSEDERKRLLEDFRVYAEKIASLPVENRMTLVLACPLLGENKQCTIYEARPLSCRMHHSRNREACEDKLSQIPVIEDFVHATVPVMEGIYYGTQAAGVVSGEVEFIPALIVALEQEDAERRWLDGEDVFADAVDHYLRAYVAKLLAE